MKAIMLVTLRYTVKRLNLEGDKVSLAFTAIPSSTNLDTRHRKNSRLARFGQRSTEMGH